MVLAPGLRRGIVILADTSLATTGGLLPLGLGLLDPTLPPPGFPRRRVAPGATLRDGVTGRFRVQDGSILSIEKHEDRLFAKTGDGPLQELAYDSAGDFYGLDTDLVIHPQRSGEEYLLQLRTLGSPLRGERIPEGPLVLDPEALKAYEGQYQVTADFSIKVVARLARIVVTGMDVGEAPLRPTAKDAFASENSGARFTFHRDKDGKVDQVTIRTSNVNLEGKRQ
jgi:hypothetical protein